MIYYNSDFLVQSRLTLICDRINKLVNLYFYFNERSLQYYTKIRKNIAEKMPEITF